MFENLKKENCLGVPTIFPRKGFLKGTTRREFLQRRYSLKDNLLEVILKTSAIFKLLNDNSAPGTVEIRARLGFLLKTYHHVCVGAAGLLTQASLSREGPSQLFIRTYEFPFTAV
jgi:hypothetical protein